MRFGWRPVGVVIALLAAFNFANNVGLRSAYPWISVVELALLVAVARAAGLNAVDLGLARDTWRRGLIWAAVAVALVAAVYAIALAIPIGRQAFLDSRANLSGARAVYAALVSVPLGTVLLEEVAFRGVLWGMVARVRGPLAATVVSSVLFGLWHIVPSLGLGTANRAVGDLYGGGASVASVVSAVVFTAIAGAVLCELRRRSGSLFAPVGLHWATNGLAYAVGALLWATHA